MPRAERSKPSTPTGTGAARLSGRAAAGTRPGLRSAPRWPERPPGYRGPSGCTRRIGQTETHAQGRLSSHQSNACPRCPTPRGPFRRKATRTAPPRISSPRGLNRPAKMAGALASCDARLRDAHDPRRQGARLLRARGVRPRRLLRGARAGAGQLGGDGGRVSGPQRRTRGRCPRRAARGSRSDLGERSSRAPGGDAVGTSPSISPSPRPRASACSRRSATSRFAGPSSPPRRPARGRVSTTSSAAPASCGAGATGSRCCRARASPGRCTCTRWRARAIPTCTRTW